jgi:phage gp45-like
MHRQTPYDASFRGFASGGSRTCIDTIDDSTLMQETNNSHGTTGETWPKSEAPQNYGFTSVVADATKDAAGKLKQCAEGFKSFIGGNRNFPVTGVMDDRRHRLKNLAKDAAKGATAMFGLKEWGHQHLITDTGIFTTANTQTKIRHALVSNQNGQTQQETPQQAQAKALPRTRHGKLLPLIRRSKSGVEFEVEVIPHAESSSGGGNGGGTSSANGGGQAGSQPTGQKTLHKEDSSIFYDMTAGSVHHGNGDSHHEVKPDRTVGYYSDNEKSYRADKSHTHIKSNGAHVWVDGVPKKSAPFIIMPDPCS